jgi:MYXO-CTERM domain-containing protein
VIDINMCAEGAQVSVLATLVKFSDDSTSMSAGSVIAIAVGAAIGLGALALLLRRRRV